MVLNHTTTATIEQLLIMLRTTRPRLPCTARDRNHSKTRFEGLRGKNRIHVHYHEFGHGCTHLCWDFCWQGSFGYARLHWTGLVALSSTLLSFHFTWCCWSYRDVRLLCVALIACNNLHFQATLCSPTYTLPGNLVEHTCQFLIGKGQGPSLWSRESGLINLQFEFFLHAGLCSWAFSSSSGSSFGGLCVDVVWMWWWSVLSVGPPSVS